MDMCCGIAVDSTALCAAAAQGGAPAVSKSIKAIGYQVGGGSTEIDLKATTLLPGAYGEAKVEAKQGATTIQAKY